MDRLGGARVDLGADGLVTVLGAGRLAAAEEAVRSVRPGEQVTVVVVTSDPAETGRLVRLRIGDLTGSLRRVFGADVWSRIRLVLDDGALVAASLGLPDPDDRTEAAVRVQDGAVRARAHGRGAAHAAASASAANGTRAPEPRA